MGALLFIPGIVAMIRLIFTDVIVAIEADRQPDSCSSREVSRGIAGPSSSRSSR